MLLAEYIEVELFVTKCMISSNEHYRDELTLLL